MSSNGQTPATPGFMLWAGRALSALVTLALLASAAMKFGRQPALLEGFAKFGYDEGLLVPIGVVEVVCTLLYAVPQTSVLGAVLVTGYLGGATATHVRVGDPFIAPIILGVLVWGGLWLRDARVRSLLPWRW